MVSFWSRATQHDAPPPNRDARKEKERAWYSSISKKTVYPTIQEPSTSSTSLPNNDLYSNNNSNNSIKHSNKPASSFRRFLKPRSSRDKLTLATATSALHNNKRNTTIHPSASASAQDLYPTSLNSNNNLHHRPLNLAQRLQELASANKDGLLDDEEYRLLRAEAFQSQTSALGSGDILQDAGTITLSSPLSPNSNNIHNHHHLSNSNSFSTLRPAPSLLSAESTRSGHSSFISSVVTSFFRRGGTKSTKSINNINTSNLNSNNNNKNTHYGSSSDSSKTLSSSPIDRNWHQVTISANAQPQVNPIEISETLSVDSFQTGEGRGALSLLGSIKSSPDLSRKSSFFRSRGVSQNSSSKNANNSSSITSSSGRGRTSGSVHENRLSSSISLHSFSPRSLTNKKYSHTSINNSISSNNNVEAWTPRRIHTKSYNSSNIRNKTSPSLSSLSAFSSSSSRILNNSTSSTASEDPWADASSEAIRREIALIEEEHQRLISSFDELSRRAQLKLEDDGGGDSISSLSQQPQLPPMAHTGSTTNNVNNKKSRPKSSITSSLLSTPLTLSSPSSTSSLPQTTTRKRSLMSLHNNADFLSALEPETNSSSKFTPPLVQIRPPSRVYTNDENGNSSSTNQASILDEIDSINARKYAVNDRYRSRLEYLSARLNSALIRERLPR